MEYDFSGWATRNNMKCSDGRVIMRDAFMHNNGKTVPLVWNHQHNNAMNVLGHAMLENRREGVYAYCKFNDTDAGKNAKLLVEHGDVTALSIYANRLKQRGPDVLHGEIREVSLVLAGANPGAFIDSVIRHGEESDDEAVIYNDVNMIELYHADKEDFDMDEDKTVEEVFDELSEEQKDVVYAMIGMALEDGEAQHSDYDGNYLYHEDGGDGDGDGDSDGDYGDDGYDDGDYDDDDYDDDDDDDFDLDDATVDEVFDSLTDTQQDVVYAIIGQALEEAEGGNDMKHNVFDQDDIYDDGVLSHSDEMNIVEMAKTNSVGSLQDAIALYSEQTGVLAHGFVDEDGVEAIDHLFPEYKDVYPGAPELIGRDQTWVSAVMQKAHKSPISRIRTRQADIRGLDLDAKGYQKGAKKALSGNVKLLKRTTDPQTIYRKDALHRDDIIDITDFDVVEYQYGIMRQNLNEEIAKAIMIGDGREEGDEAKIAQEHVRSIWLDDDLYTIHHDVDIEAARNELQGGDTSKHFGENYIYAEAIVTAALYSREKYKGSGSLEFYCTPHLLNVMLLARDLNGRRIYDSKADLAAALNVTAIHTAEQFEGKTRKDKDGNDKKLLGIFVNLADYQIGSTKGGEITRFSQFDIDFNQEKYLIETRISGALTRVYSAIALEEPVVQG